VPLEAEGTRNHYPAACTICGTVFELWDPNRGHSAHVVLDLEPVGGGIRIACLRHVHHATQCACGAVTAARPGMGVLSTMPGRSRDLLLSEACLVGPALATFIAALSVRYHISRARIREFLAGWFGVTLSVGTLDRCIREVGVACEPVVEDLLDDLRQAGVIHADETPWRQKEKRCWLWVVLSSTTAIFHIGSRQGEEIRDLIGDAFLGWLVSDGYRAYRSYKKRQRCPDPQGGGPGRWPQPAGRPLRGVAAARGPHPRGRRGHRRPHPQSDSRPSEARLQPPPRRRG